jgi:hypothetical protein
VLPGDGTGAEQPFDAREEIVRGLHGPIPSV